MAKGGGAEVAPTKRGKGMRIMAIVDRHGLPLSVSSAMVAAIANGAAFAKGRDFAAWLGPRAEADVNR